MEADTSFYEHPKIETIDLIVEKVLLEDSDLTEDINPGEEHGW